MNPANISEAYNQKKTPASFEKLLKKNEAKFTELLGHMKNSQPFLRGEIEDEKVLNGTLVWLQFAILKIREKPETREEIAQAWIQFAADLAYEEANLIGLKFSHVVRSLMFDELETHLAKGEASDAWIKTVRAPWPIDRVVMLEAKRALKPASIALAEKIAKDLQKNRYQSIEDAMKKLKKQTPEEMEFLKKLWKPADILTMKEEITRIGKLQILWAKARFKTLKGKDSTSVQELVGEKLLDRIPVDYVSGRQLTL